MLVGAASWVEVACGNPSGTSVATTVVEQQLASLAFDNMAYHIE
jgi:hypothetical protein